MRNDWTSERPTEEGFYWLCGWDSVYRRDENPCLYIAELRQSLHDGLRCFVDGNVRYEYETLGLWQRQGLVAFTLADLNDDDVFSRAVALRGSQYEPVPIGERRY